jgi:hypothetical protein
MVLMPDDTPHVTPGPSWSRPITESQPLVDPPEAPAARGDDAARAIVTRLARRHPSGGRVVERAAILAEGADCAAVVAWIIAHRGEPEAAVSAPRRGLHSARLADSPGAGARAPVRYVLPADVFA